VHTTVKILATAADTARSRALLLSVDKGRRVTVQEMVEAMILVADKHPDEVAALISKVKVSV